MSAVLTHRDFVRRHFFVITVLTLALLWSRLLTYTNFHKPAAEAD